MTLNLVRFGWSGAATALATLGAIAAAGCDGDRFIGEGPGSLGGGGSKGTSLPGTTGSGASATQITHAGAGGIIGPSTLGGASGTGQSAGGSGGASGAASSAGGVGGTSVGSTNVGGAAGSSPIDPCKGLEGDWSVTPVVKALARDWTSPLPAVGSERAPIGLRLTKKDDQHCSLELMPRWSPSWHVDLAGSAQGLAFDRPLEQQFAVAIECPGDSTWYMPHLGMITGGEPRFQWSSWVEMPISGGDVSIGTDITLEGAMQRGLPPLQFDDYRTYGKTRDWCAASEPACYSPTQNTHRAYDVGSVGCPCNLGSDRGVCVSYDDAGREHLVALVCGGERWQAVIDGPCMEAVMGDTSVIVPAIPDSAKLLPWEKFGVHASQPSADFLSLFTASVAGQAYPVTVVPAAEPMASRQNSVHASDWAGLMGKTLYLQHPDVSNLRFAYGFAQLPILPAYTGQDLAQLVHNAQATLTTLEGSVVLLMQPEHCPGEKMYAAGRLATTDKTKVEISLRESVIPLRPPTLIQRDGTQVAFTRKGETLAPDDSKDVVFEARIVGQSEVGVEVTIGGTCPPSPSVVLRSITTE